MGAVENPAAVWLDKLNDSEELPWNQTMEELELEDRGSRQFIFPENVEDEEDEDTLVSSGTETDTEQPHVIEDSRPNNASPRKSSKTKSQIAHHSPVFSGDSDSDDSDRSYITSYSSSSDPSSGSNSSSSDDDAVSDSSDSSSSCLCSDSSSDSLSCDSSSESESEGTKAAAKSQTKIRGSVRNHVVSIFGIMGYGGIWRRTRQKESSGRRRAICAREVKSPSTRCHSLPSAKMHRGEDGVLKNGVGEGRKDSTRAEEDNDVGTTRITRPKVNTGVGSTSSGTNAEESSLSLAVCNSATTDREPSLELERDNLRSVEAHVTSSSIQNISPRSQEENL